MTQIEHITLQNMSIRNPALLDLISRLDLDTTSQSQADIHSIKVSNRINQIHTELQYSPVVERSCISDPSAAPRCFWSSQELATWITDNNFTL